MNFTPRDIPDNDPQETQEWLESLDALLTNAGEERTYQLLQKLQDRAISKGLNQPYYLNTPYLNTLKEDLPYPGDLSLEKRIRRVVRWNALMMVVRANKKDSSIGGHLATPASICQLYEVGFHHFFKGNDDGEGDLVFFQGHSSPAIYARSFLEGRFDEEKLDAFRREASPKEHPKGGLSSYPHPHLMGDYWQFPTVSLGLGGVQSIYQARLMKYLENRELLPQTDRHVWVFLGDGEMDEHQNLAPLWIAGRESLDNLTYVVNCNLQRLDGPVMGNDKVVNRLEGVFKGAGWNVIKLLWSSAWDKLFEKDTEGHLVRALSNAPDGEIQAMRVLGTVEGVKDFFAKNDSIASMVDGFSDEDFKTLRRGGHDEVKIHTAYQKARAHKGAPTVILVQTVKGFGLPGIAGTNSAHSQKKPHDDELLTIRDMYHIPLSDDEVKAYSFYHPGKDSEEVKYTNKMRENLGGFLPKRKAHQESMKAPTHEEFSSLYQESKRPYSTTMAFVRTLSLLLKNKKWSQFIVPIVADEARTFGMEGLFPQIKIYAHEGQKYTPHDHNQLLKYSESKQGQLLQEGITEDGASASWLAAGVASDCHNIPLIPFYIYYSMFGFQRVGDMFWAAGDIKARGFLLGATSGRTTLAGEGLQHDDGQNILFASANPACRAYDPSHAYEVSAIIQAGMEAMYEKGERCFYYISVYNENQPHPSLPSQDILPQIKKGMYLFKKAESPKIHLLSSGSIFKEAEKAIDILKQYGVEANLFSAPSFNEMAREGAKTQRENLRTSKNQKSYAQTCLGDETLPVLAATDYVRTYPAQIAPYIKNPFFALGTDGFGLSDNRPSLRSHFEVDSKHIAFYALSILLEQGKIKPEVLKKARKELDIPEQSFSLNR